MIEVACEGLNTCNNDQQSFKGYLAQWMAGTTQFVPETYDGVMKRLATTAVAAAAQCIGGNDGQTCGLIWDKGPVWDGSSGPGQQMSAMSVICEYPSCLLRSDKSLTIAFPLVDSNLIQQVKAPVTNTTGGNSTGNYAAGSSGDDVTILNGRKFTTADKAGAAILSVLFGSAIVGGAIWMAF